MITSMFLCAHRHGNLITRELAVGLCPFLSLVVRFGRSAAQILQNGPRQLGQLGCAPCSPSGGPFWPLSSPNPSKRTSPPLPLGGGGVGAGVGWGGMITSMFLCAHRHGNLITRELAVGLCPFLSLVVRFGRSAAQILQNGPRQLGQLGCAPCSPSGGPFWPLSSPNPSKRTSPALPLGGGGVGGGVGWGRWDDNVHVPVRTQARQPHQTRAGGGSLSLSLPGGPFWALSSPNPPKRTSPAWSAWLCSLLFLWWSVSAAQQPESFKTDLASLVSLAVLSLWCSVLAAQQPKSSKTDLAMLFCLAVLLALPLVVRFGRSAAQIRQNGPPLLFQPHRSLSLSLPGAPFCPLSGLNPPKRTSPAWSAWLCSLLSLWWSVLAAQQPKSSKTDLASLVCLAGLLALPPVVRFGRPNTPKRTSPALPTSSVTVPFSPWCSVLSAERPKSSKTDHQGESKEHSQADQHGEVRFGAFDPLSGQNGAPGRERKETHRQLSCDEVAVPVCVQEHGRYNPWKSWGGPILRIWAAKRPKRTTRQSKERRRADQEWQLGRSVLEDLGHSADKTEYQREKGAQKHSHRRKEDTKQKNSWASPLLRISAALLPRRATRNSKEHRQANQDWESWGGPF